MELELCGWTRLKGILAEAVQEAVANRMPWNLWRILHSFMPKVFLGLDEMDANR